MAKTNGSALGKWRGRMGGQVFAVSGGLQIIREYNPVVANPRTSLQQQQRARVTLAGMLSKITPSEVIIGMAASKRDRRSAFVRYIIKNSAVSNDGTEWTASLGAASLKFSDGPLVGGVIATIDSVTNAAAIVNCTLSDNVAGVMVVAVQYNPTTARYEFINYAISTQRSGIVTVPLEGNVAQTGANIYYVPLVARASNASVSAEGVGRQDDSYTGSLSIPSADAFEHMASVYVGYKAVEQA